MSFQPMKLSLLEPELLKRKQDGDSVMGVLFSKADGLFFVCPLCYSNNGMKRPGVHGIICWQPHVPQDVTPGPGRWTFKGSSLEDITLVAGSSSIHLTGPGCGAHFFIENGMVRTA